MKRRDVGPKAAKFCMQTRASMSVTHGLGLMSTGVIVTIYFRPIQHHLTLPKVNKIQNLPIVCSTIGIQAEMECSDVLAYNRYNGLTLLMYDTYKGRQ